jgi:hypothetical protein
MPTSKNKESKTLSFLPQVRKDYGGELRKKAANRKARPLVYRSGTVHIVLRSTQACGENSFQHKDKRRPVENFVRQFSLKKGVKLVSFANVGNHLHLHVKLTNYTLYVAWIRGLCSGLAMLSMGRKGLARLKEQQKKFWNFRPYSKIILSFKQWINTKKYLEINFLEGLGVPRIEAELLVKGSWHLFRSSS